MLQTVFEQCDVLIIVDDLMQELHCSKDMEKIYSKGRHRRISLISLEQDLTHSSVIERRNVDYIVLFQIRDFGSLDNFYRTYFADLKPSEFRAYYNFSVGKYKGFIIIDFASPFYKYRVNSFNRYYDPVSQTLKEILLDDTENNDLASMNEHFARFKIVQYNNDARYKAYKSQSLVSYKGKS